MSEQSKDLVVIDLDAEAMKNFADHTAVIDEWEKKEKELVVTSIDDETNMDLAAAAEVKLGKVIKAVENLRKSLKEESLRKGQAIDKAAKTITERLVPLRKRLQDKANYRAVFEANRIREIRERRTPLVAMYGIDLSKDMLTASEEEFEMMVADVKIIHERQQKILQDQQEAERLKKEQEARRLVELEAENKRLKDEAMQKMALARDRRAKIHVPESGGEDLYIYFNPESIHRIGELSQEEFDADLADAINKRQTVIEKKQRMDKLQAERMARAEPVKNFLKGVDLGTLYQMSIHVFNDLIDTAHEDMAEHQRLISLVESTPKNRSDRDIILDFANEIAVIDTPKVSTEEGERGMLAAKEMFNRMNAYLVNYCNKVWPQ